MTVIDSPPSSGRKKLSRPTEIAATIRSRAIRGFMKRIHDGIGRHKGVVLIAPPEDSLELPSVLEAVALQCNASMPLDTRPPIYDALNMRDHGLSLRQPDQLPDEQQERLLLWMRRSTSTTQPVFAIFTSERRWRYCTKRDSRPPTSQRDRVVRWSEGLLAEFMPQPIEFPALKHRQDDLLGIVIQTLEALKLTKEQSNVMLDDATTHELLQRPPSNDLLLVNEVCNACRSILRADLRVSRPSMDQRPHTAPTPDY